LKIHKLIPQEFKRYETSQTLLVCIGALVSFPQWNKSSSCSNQKKQKKQKTKNKTDMKQQLILEAASIFLPRKHYQKNVSKVLALSRIAISS